VSGIGHETDWTLAERAADFRAATPTAAALALSPDRADWLGDLAHRQRRIAFAWRRRLESAWQRLDGITRGLVHPRTRIAQQRTALEAAARHLQGAAAAMLQRRRAALESFRERLLRSGPIARRASQAAEFDAFRVRLTQAVRAGFELRKQALLSRARRLQTVNPLATLERGYALVFAADGRAIVRAGAVTAPAEIGVRLRDGFLDCLVTGVRRT
jgi:exodeoxyribonuclease VII large subunit